MFHGKHRGCHTCSCAVMELYGRRGGFSAEWDIKLSCLLGRPCAAAVPYASCAIFQLFPLFVATAVVLLSCYIKLSRDAVGFFFLLDFSTFPLCEGTIWHSYYIRTCRQFPLRQYTRAGLHVEEEMKEGGREGRRWARLLPRTKITEYSGLVS